MQCVQGLLNYQPNGPKDGGLILMKGSSKLFDEFFAEGREQDEHEDKPPPEAEMRDLFIFKEADVEWFKSRGCTLQKIDMEPGDMVSHPCRFFDFITNRHYRYSGTAGLCITQLTRKATSSDTYNTSA
jgi:hypothetical protein